MVHPASLMSAVIVAIAPVAHAWQCSFGVDYCGATLTKYGRNENPSAWCETTKDNS